MKGGSSNSNCNKHHHHQPQQHQSSTTEVNHNESMTEYNPEIQAPSSQLSSAYIRTLVKHLTTTSTDATATTTPSRNKGKGNNNSNGNNMGCMAEQGGDGASHTPQAARKKQIRRRLHTSRPYQERLLNMAEARKEIAAALNFHRASMKQQQQQQQQQQHNHSPPALPVDMICISSPMDQQDDPDHRYLMSMNNNYSSFPSYNDNNTHINNFNKWPYDSPQYGYQCPWQSSPLPSQSLGLNLSLSYQDFSNLDPNFINLLQHKELIPSTSTSPSPSSPSSSSPPPPSLSYITGNINAGGIATDGDAESHGSELYLEFSNLSMVVQLPE